MKTSLAVKLQAGVVAAVLLAGCGGGSGDSSDQPRELKVAVGVDISSWDPIRGNTGGDQVLLYPIYDTLVSFDSGMEPKPGLAESWESPSPNELTLHLREGVTFHDGTPFDAEAVKFNLDRAHVEGSSASADISMIENVRVDDDQTVTLELSQPDSSIVLALADRAGMMVSPEAIGEDGELIGDPVGTGGWTFGEWKQGSQIRLDRYEDYWDTDAVRAETLQFNIFADSRTRATSLQSGQQDVALELQPADVSSLDNADSVELEQMTSVFLVGIYLDTDTPEFSDARVRRALSIAVDRDALVDGALFGRGQAARGYLPDDYWAAPPEDVGYDYDPDEAESLLAEAGAEALTFDMLSRNEPGTVRVAEILKEQWAEIGVTVNIIPRDTVEATDQYFSQRSTESYLAGWSGRPDPGMTYSQLFDPAGFYNVAGLEIPGFVEAMEAADAGTDPEERVPGLDAAAEAVNAETPFIPIVFQDVLIGRDADLTGLEINPMGKPKFIGVGSS